MAGFVTTLRSSRATAINTAIGTSGLLRIYSTPRPATGAAVGAAVLLAELPCSATFGTVGTVGSVVTLTAGTITADSSANASGDAVWARLTTSAGAAVVDMSVTASGGGGELQLSSVTIVATGNVSVSSLVITEGNA